MNSLEQKKDAFARLLQIMDELRVQCPWDKKQTMETLRILTIEETYELADAIIEKDRTEIKKELGDLFLHLVFYSRIASEEGNFDVADVLHSVCEKLIERHPHIYGDPANGGKVVIVKDENEVKANWEKIKLKGGNKSVLAGVPVSLPSMAKATRIQEKARGVGFDWDNEQQVWEKVNEELGELKVEIDQKSNKIEEEFGDLLFSLINYARFIGVNPEDALERTNKKFIRRFTFLEENVKKDGKILSEMNLEEMDVYWNKAKETEK